MEKLDAVKSQANTIVEPIDVTSPYFCDINNSEIMNVATSAIGTVTSVATYSLGVLSFIIALVSLVSVFVLYKGCVKACKMMAAKKLNDYLQTDTFASLLDERIAQGIEEKMRNTTFVHIQPEQVQVDDSSFPMREEGNNDT